MGKMDKNMEASQQSIATQQGAGSSASKVATTSQNSAVAEQINKVAAKKQKTVRNVIIAVVLALVVIAVAVVLFVFLLNGGNATGAADSSQSEGQAPYKTEEEMQAESERQIPDGMFNISIATDIEFDNAESEGSAYIENVPNNPYDMQVTITEDETGDVVYESGIITPNHYIEKIKLQKSLGAGEHDATATFTAINPETDEQVGQAAAKVTLDIKN